MGKETGMWDSYIRTDYQLVTKQKMTANTKNLDYFDAIVFVNTTGKMPLDEGQKKDLLAYVHDEGKGFVGVHASLDFIALEARFDRLAHLERNDAGNVRETSAPQAATVDRHGNDRKPQSSVQRRKTRSKWRGCANSHSRPFRIDDHGPASRGHRLAVLNEGPQRFGARRALDRNDAITPGHPAKEGDVGEFFLDVRPFDDLADFGVQFRNNIFRHIGRAEIALP